MFFYIGKKSTLSFVLSATLFSVVMASSDPNVYKNQSKTENYEDETKYVSVDLVHLLMRSRLFNSRLLRRPIHHENDIEDNTYSRKLMENADFIDGDMRGDASSIDQLRNALIDPRLRWPKAVIPYVVSTDFNPNERNVIAQAMLEYHKGTCIRFVPRTNQQDYIVFRTTGTGCNSNVGRTGGAQTVSLDTGCVHVGIVIHELMHAAGFFHEQSRTDRDDHVLINWDNIQEANKRNFDKLSLKEIQYLGVAYDTGSVMHYDKFAFAKNPSMPTIVSKSGGKLGNTEGFSKSDLIKLNRLYQCELPGTTIVPSTSSATTTPTTSLNITTSAPVKITTFSVTESTSPATTTVPTGEKECSDSGPGCSLFRDQGFCSKSVELMTVFCKKTCDLCRVEPCADKDELCEFWAEKGECKANPNYMLANCKKSCDMCKLF